MITSERVSPLREWQKYNKGYALEKLSLSEGLISLKEYYEKKLPMEKEYLSRVCY